MKKALTLKNLIKKVTEYYNIMIQVKIFYLNFFFFIRIYTKSLVNYKINVEV